MNKKHLKLAVVGCRDFNNYEFIKERLIHFIDSKQKQNYIIEIVSGGANGVDSLAYKFANEYNLKFKCFNADWDKYGKKAGYIRNKQIVEYSNHVIAFWDYKSKGTKITIDLANKYGIMINIIDINKI